LGGGEGLRRGFVANKFSSNYVINNRVMSWCVYFTTMFLRLYSVGGVVGSLVNFELGSTYLFPEKKRRDISVRMAVVPLEIRNGHVTNTSQERYHC
jgi:hypothetical protein